MGSPAALGGDAAATQTDMDILNDEGTPDAGKGSGAGEAETETPPDAGGEIPATEEEKETPDVPAVGEEEKPEEEKPDEEETEEDRANRAAVTHLAAEVKAKYPTLFKEFPDLRKALFREQQYAELIPTVEDAREMVERDRDFQEYEEKVMDGDSSTLLRTIGSTDPAALEKFVMNFLPTVEQLAPEVHGKALFPYIRRIFVNTLRDAKQAGNVNLENSLGHVAKYLWGTPEIPDERREAPPSKTREQLQMEEENRQLRGARAAEFKSAVVGDGLKTFEKSVSDTFVKDARFSPIERKALTTEIVERVRVALDRDARYNRNINAMWQRASQSAHPRALIPKLVTTFLGGAKSVMPAIRAKVVADALKQKGIVEPAKGQQPGTPRGGAPGSGKAVVSSKNIDYARTSDADILGDDPSKITLKKTGK
jgi:hypothetical protein